MSRFRMWLADCLSYLSFLVDDKKAREQLESADGLAWGNYPLLYFSVILIILIGAIVFAPLDGEGSERGSSLWWARIKSFDTRDYNALTVGAIIIAGCYTVAFLWGWAIADIRARRKKK